MSRVKAESDLPHTDTHPAASTLGVWTLRRAGSAVCWFCGLPDAQPGTPCCLPCRLREDGQHRRGVASPQWGAGARGTQGSILPSRTSSLPVLNVNEVAGGQL